MTNEAGLQFEGVPSERALRASACLACVGLFLNGFRDLSDNDWDIIEEALELMAKEKTNGE